MEDKFAYWYGIPRNEVDWNPIIDESRGRSLKA